MAARRMDFARYAAEGLVDDAVRGWSDRRQDDRGARRRSELRPGAVADADCRTVGAAPLLADLPGGRGGQSADRYPRVWLWWQRADRRRLAILLPGRDGRPCAVPAGRADQPDLRGRVRTLPDAKGRADRGRLRLGGVACLADGSAVREAAQRGTAPEAPALRVHSQ